MGNSGSHIDFPCAARPDELSDTSYFVFISSIMQVCTHWLKGYCAFGDKCRYDHVHPDWAPKRRDETKNGFFYEAPVVPKPDVDNLADMLPISKLRLSSSVDSRHQNGFRETPKYQARESSCPVELPIDPFGSGVEQTCAAGSKSEANESYVHYEKNDNFDHSVTYGDAKNTEIDDIDVAGSYGAEDTTYWLGDSSVSPCPGEEIGQMNSNDPWSVVKDGRIGWVERIDESANFGAGTSSLCQEYFRSGHCSSEACKFSHGTFCEVILIKID